MCILSGLIGDMDRTSSLGVNGCDRLMSCICGFVCCVEVLGCLCCVFLFFLLLFFFSIAPVSCSSLFYFPPSSFLFLFSLSNCPPSDFSFRCFFILSPCLSSSFPVTYRCAYPLLCERAWLLRLSCHAMPCHANEPPDPKP